MKLSKMKNLISKNTKILCDLNEIGIMYPGEKKEYAIDPRTKKNDEGLNEIHPIAFGDGHYWYICFDCGQVHMSETLGKIIPSCCLDSDCERHQFINGNHHLIKREPIYLVEDESK